MKLIYVMDPLCGWCYGNTANTQKVYEKYMHIYDFEILPAGMWVGANARKQTKQMADFIKRHDPQVQQATGTEFGSDYFKFIENENVLLDSEVPSRAIVTVKKLWPALSVIFTAEVQKARYWFGKDLNEDATYLDICEGLKLDKEKFLGAFHSELLKQETMTTFALAHQYAHSYPALLAETEGEVFVLEQGYASFEQIVNRINKVIC